jgi:hypothetical protein
VVFGKTIVAASGNFLGDRINCAVAFPSRCHKSVTALLVSARRAVPHAGEGAPARGDAGGVNTRPGEVIKNVQKSVVADMRADALCRRAICEVRASPKSVNKFAELLRIPMTFNVRVHSKVCQIHEIQR